MRRVPHPSLLDESLVIDEPDGAYDESSQSVGRSETNEVPCIRIEGYKRFVGVAVGGPRIE